jgi:hypothetical protein
MFAQDVIDKTAECQPLTEYRYYFYDFVMVSFRHGDLPAGL